MIKKKKELICDVCDCSMTLELHDLDMHGWAKLQSVELGINMVLCPVCAEKLKNVVDEFFKSYE